MKPRKLVIRKFLNKKNHQMLAGILTELDVSNNELTGAIHITDCDRRISLDFNAWSWRDGALEEEFDNGLNKLDILIDVLTRFRQRYIEMYEYLQEQREEA